MWYDAFKEEKNNISTAGLVFMRCLAQFRIETQAARKWRK